MAKETGETSTQNITLNKKQFLFLKYTLAVLVDLSVLNLFSQYWDFLFIETFVISLFVALLLQFVMKVAIKVEYYAALFLEMKMGLKSKIHRGISAWAVLFISKLVILEVLNVSFGDSVVFSGPLHGVVAFLIVVIVIIVVEQLIAWLYRSLADVEIKSFSPIDPLDKEI